MYAEHMLPKELPDYRPLGRRPERPLNRLQEIYIR